MKKRILIILFIAMILLIVALTLTSCGGAAVPEIEAAEPTEVYPITRIYRFPYYSDIIYYVIYKDKDEIYHEIDRFDTDYNCYTINVGSNKDTINFYGNSEIMISLTVDTYLNMPFVGY